MVPPPLPRDSATSSGTSGGGAPQRSDLELQLQRAASDAELRDAVAAAAAAPGGHTPETVRIALARAAQLVRAAAEEQQQQQQQQAGGGGGADAAEAAAAPAVSPALGEALVLLTRALVEVHVQMSVRQLAGVLHTYAKLGLLPGESKLRAGLKGEEGRGSGAQALGMSGAQRSAG